MPTCSDEVLTGNIDRDCNHTPQQGTQEVYLANFADIDYTTSTLTGEDTLVTGIALKATKKIYQVDVLDTGGGVAHSGARDRFGFRFTHTQRLEILDVTPATWEQLQKLRNGNMVAITKTKDGGNSNNYVFKVAGWKAGMKITSDSFDSDADDSARLIELTSQEGSLEDTGIKLFLDTDLATTETWVSTNLFS